MTVITGRHPHVFGRARPSHQGQYPIHTAPERDTHFRDLPPPTGSAPFHLDLREIIPHDNYQAIVDKKKLTFHLNGDMGGIEFSVPQELVAKGMEADFNLQADASENPAFLYITGDCVYFNGGVQEYYKQFYQPYEFYRAAQCLLDPTDTAGKHRWLYSNVPAGGDIRSPQTEWLINELRTLPTEVPLLIALHHPVYSADDHHSGSTYMKDALEHAAQQAGRHPEMILAGHVHDYQRLTKNMAGDVKVPYLVVGAGGYHNLHTIMKVDGQRMVPPVVFDDKQGDPVTLERYSDDHHGFLRMEITDQLVVGRYYEVPRPQEPYSKGNQLLEYFEFDWRNRRYLPNTL